jgi:flagellar biosynthetic protein FliO
MGSEYSHMIINLFAVVTLMCSLFYLFKNSKFSKYAANKHITIINSVSIGSKERILLIKANNTVLLVGATANHIQTLHVFNELELADSLAHKTTFSEQLMTLNNNTT